MDGYAAPEPRDTAQYLAAVREHWVLVLAVLAVAVAAAGVFATTRATTYVSEADVLVSPVDPGDATLTGLGLLQDGSGSVFTAGRLLETPQVQDLVIRRLHLPDTRRELMHHVTISPLQQSNIVSIEASGATAGKATALANAFADALIRERSRVFQARLAAAITRLQARRDALGTTPAAADTTLARSLDARIADLTSLVGENDPTLQIWSRAVPPDGPKATSAVGIVAAFFAALLLAAGLALLLELMSGRIRREHEAAGLAPILARVPRLRRTTAERYLAHELELPPGGWEPYRLLRARLAAASANGELPATIAVTSAVKGEGKTMTAVNLAKALAAGGEPIVLVDANLRDRGVARAFGLPEPRRGLLALLAGACDPDDVLVPAGRPHGGVVLLLPEREASQALELLDRRRVSALLEALSLRGTVIVDLPAMTEYGEAVAIAGAADTVLLCVRLGRSSRDATRESLAIAARDGISVAGIVLTGRHRASARGAQPLFERAPQPPVHER